MSRARRPPPWSDLPSELLGLVFLRLPKRADRAFFTAVCRTWCAAARQCRLPLPSPVPWLVVPGGSAISLGHGGGTVQLPDGVCYHHATSGECLVFSRDDDSCFLMNPFTKATIPLPSLRSYNPYEEPVQVAEDDMALGLDNVMQNTWMDIKDTGKVSVRSLTLCSTRLVAAIVTVGVSCTIALCRPGAAAWSVSAHDQTRCLSQMVFLHGKIFTLENAHDLIAIDIVDDHDSDEPRMSRMERLIAGASSRLQRYPCSVHHLLESHGTLLMVRRNLFQETRHDDGSSGVARNKFEMFNADFECHLWAEARTLQNYQALFLGPGCSRAVQVSPYDISRDCIFFLDYFNWPFFRLVGSCGVYDMKDEKVHSPLPMVSWNAGTFPATWFFSQDAGQTNKAQTVGEHVQETVEPEEEGPLALEVGGTFSAGDISVNSETPVMTS
ncbi:hypothetical protein U9M48_034783 [Paspalum notatum var. saurae]|uniref:DUF295 domain-containing protein n=1 Tax=Paspalum notatum var. saurae TaxID=547442 RepID=A0AAQ3X7Q1_PASNO